MRERRPKEDSGEQKQHATVVEWEITVLGIRVTEVWIHQSADKLFRDIN